MVVLATRCYVEGAARERAIDSLESLVADQVGDLEVTWTTGVREDGFPAVTLEGPDATAARNHLREVWGTVTPPVDVGGSGVGTLASWDDNGFILDAGESIRIPVDRLGLGQGDPGQIRRRFGLVQHVPLRFSVDADGARLADSERDRLYDWRRGTGRVNVNSATRSEVRATLNRAGHARDVVTVERLGLLEQSVVCRAGTDPAGLLASVGDYLRAELLAVVP